MQRRKACSEVTLLLLNCSAALGLSALLELVTKKQWSGRPTWIRRKSKGVFYIYIYILIFVIISAQKESAADLSLKEQFKTLLILNYRTALGLSGLLKLVTKKQ